MLTVHQMQGRTGVSVRTLHYYDDINLLKPTKVTEAGYRMYDEAAIERLQIILFFRELQFPLKEIREILDRPNFDRRAALRDQVELLKMQRAHLDGLIALAQTEMEGKTDMKDFTPFDRSELDAYAKEAKERWGNTEAYRAYEEQAKTKTLNDSDSANARLMQVFQGFAAIKQKGLAADSKEAKAKAGELMETITKHFYPCTKPILAGLGQMYVGDERFMKNIDQYGEGTAAFASEAIAAYCKE